MRLGFSTTIMWSHYFDDPATSIEVTDSRVRLHPWPLNSYDSGCQPLVDGGDVLRQTAGSGKSQVFVSLPKSPVHRQRDVQGRGESISGGTWCCGRVTRSPSIGARW